MISPGSNFLFQYSTFFYPFSDYHFYVRIQEKRGPPSLVPVLNINKLVFLKNLFNLGLQFFTNMKPYSNQLYGPTTLPYTVGVTGQSNLVDQKISVHKLWPGYHTTIHTVPKILETSSNFDNLPIDQRNCKLPHETSGFKLFQEYTQKGCEIECAAKKAMTFCKCLPWHYPNNFSSLPMCDMFGGFCFNEIMSDEVFYKGCKLECLPNCQEISLSLWQRSAPLNIEDLCKDGTFFDKFFEQNLQRLFAFEHYRSMVQEQRIPDLAISLSNGSLCREYIWKYISFVSVESATESISKSQLDRSTSFIDQLRIIGGNLGLCVGMSVVGMFEAMTFIFIVVKSSVYDIRTLWRKFLSYFGPNVPKISQELAHKRIVVCNGQGFKDNNEDNGFEESQKNLKKLYVMIFLIFFTSHFSET